MNGRRNAINVQEVPNNSESTGGLSVLREEPTSRNTSQELWSNIGNKESHDVQGNCSSLPRASYWNLFHLMTILATSAFFLSPQLLIPRHHPIFYPEYWYEGIMLVLFASLTSTLKSMVDCVVLIREKSLMTFSILLKTFICQMVPYVSLYCISRYFWTSIMEFQHPMPLLGIFVMFGRWITFLCCLYLGCRLRALVVFL